MPSPTALKKAGQDVRRYHSRRVFVDPLESSKGRGFSLGCVGVAFGSFLFVIGFRDALLLAPFLAGAVPSVLIFMVYRSAFLDKKRREEETGEAFRKYNQAIHLLTQSMDIEAVGPLCEILWFPGISVYVPLALRRLLPLLQPEHASLLSSKQRDNLLRILTKPDPDSLELQRATVKAMGNIGDAKALPILEQLVGGALGAEYSSDLCEDARIALFKLQERINPGYAGRNLLRASDAPSVSSDVLFRPATSSVETPPQELLRPHNSP